MTKRTCSVTNLRKVMPTVNRYILVYANLCFRTSDIYLIPLVALIGSIRLSFANEIDGIH